MPLLKNGILIRNEPVRGSLRGAGAPLKNHLLPLINGKEMGFIGQKSAINPRHREAGAYLPDLLAHLVLDSWVANMAKYFDD